jgi:hypothetical protein
MARAKGKSLKQTRTSKEGQKTMVVFHLDTIPISAESQSSSLTQAGNLGERILKGIGVKATKIAADQIQNNMDHFLNNMQEILSKSASTTEAFQLNEVEVNAEVSADGQIGFMGTQVGMSGTAGIKFVFKRK